MKRLFAGTAAGLLAVVLLFPIKAQAISARRAYAMDAISGKVLYERSPQ